MHGPTKVQDGPRHEFQDIIGEKNVDFHATFDDEEPQQLISLCEKLENKSYLESPKQTVAGVRKLVEDLEDMRNYFIANFILEDGRKTVTKESKLNEEIDFS